MEAKWVIIIALLAGILGSIAGVRGYAQAANSPWQMVASGSSDGGGVAWKYNVETGQSFYCYRQNCFAQVLQPFPQNK